MPADFIKIVFFQAVMAAMAAPACSSATEVAPAGGTDSTEDSAGDVAVTQRSDSHRSNGSQTPASNQAGQTPEAISGSNFSSASRGEAYVVFLAGPVVGGPVGRHAGEAKVTWHRFDKICAAAGRQIANSLFPQLNRFKALISTVPPSQGVDVGPAPDDLDGAKPLLTFSDTGIESVGVSLAQFLDPTPGIALTNPVVSFADGARAPAGTMVWTGQTLATDGTVVPGSACEDSSGVGHVGSIGEVANARWLASGTVQNCASTQAVIYCLGSKRSAQLATGDAR